MFSPTNLGSAAFREDYGLRMAYVTGAMVKGIASPALVVAIARAGGLGFYGSGGVRLEEVERAIGEIRAALDGCGAWGVNLLANVSRPDQEMALVDLLLRCGVRNAEASAFMQVSPAIVRFRLHGVTEESGGRIRAANRILAKVSRPEIAQLFLSPAPEPIVRRLLESGLITAQEAALAPRIPLASDLTVEADSGGHTDMGVLAVLLPTMIRLRNQLQQEHGYSQPVRIGAAGGIGTPEAAACAFMLGADFLVTGSINQCTVEAGTSDAVKDMLQSMSVRDTAYAPAGDLFELGAKIQVMKKGVFFPARALRLHELWRYHGSLDEIDATTRRDIQDKYLGRSFEEVWRETRDYYGRQASDELERAESNPKARMALVFRWYFVHSMRLALAGSVDRRVDWQVHTGPALGAFNDWVRATPLENWRNRRVATIADTLMTACAERLDQGLRMAVRP